MELVHKITALGGRIRAEGGCLVVAPKEAVIPFLNELKRYKPELLALLEQSTLGSIPLADLDAWREPFVRWLNEFVFIHPACYGGLNKLHESYSDWEIRTGGVPCDRGVFLALLGELGAKMSEYSGTVLVSGMALCEVIDLYFPRHAAMKTTSAMRSAA
jgi:hypothetical protein